ncbi:MAG: DUF3108 domain-containing protein [Pseudolabrys sp.]
MAVATVFCVFAGADGALAQGKLDAQYTAYLAGLPVGKGSWAIDIEDNQYSASANGQTTGLIRVFTGGKGTSAARGAVSGGQLLASTYTASIQTKNRTDEVQLTIASGVAKDVHLTPPQDDDPERVPVTEAQRHGITDPMTGSLVRVAGTGEVLAPESCDRSASLFDGRLRYDLRLAYKHMDTVRADKGYAGPALVCAVYFTPVAGHIPSRAAMKYLAASRDMEVWLVPIAGTRVLVPFRFQVPTPIGLAKLEAHQFITTAQPARAVAKGNKTQ